MWKIGDLFVFGVGYRRLERVYYFNSSGYWSRSSPLLVSRAPSVHLLLTHTPKLCPYLQSSEAQPSSHSQSGLLRGSLRLDSATVGSFRHWFELVWSSAWNRNLSECWPFFFLSKNILCLTYSLKSLIYDSHFALYSCCWEILRFSGWNLNPIIYWHLLDMWSQCMCMSQINLNALLNGQVNRTLFSWTFRKTEPCLRLIWYIGLLKNVLLVWNKSHVLFI